MMDNIPQKNVPKYCQASFTPTINNDRTLSPIINITHSPYRWIQKLTFNGTAKLSKVRVDGKEEIAKKLGCYFVFYLMCTNGNLLFSIGGIWNFYQIKITLH